MNDAEYFVRQGALAGGFGSICFNAWLTIGGMLLRRRLPTLPPASTAGCVSSMYAANATHFDSITNMTTFTNDMYENVTSSMYGNYDNITPGGSFSSRVSV